MFHDFDPKELTIEKWNSGYTAIEKVDVPSPDSTEGVNWDWIADYCLLAASSSWKEFEEANGRRNEMNQAYADRIAANRERIERNNKFIRLVLEKVAGKSITELESVADGHSSRTFPYHC